jgi:hypothetical protein
MHHIAERLCIPYRRHYANSVERQALETEQRRLVQNIEALDRDLMNLAEQRSRLRRQVDDIRDVLWPREPSWHSRRPHPGGRGRLEPVSADAKALVGAGLRATCMAVLERHGTQSLPELHSLLHLYGYRIGGQRPVKDLADAMAHEVDHGRAIRVKRGHYRALRESSRQPRAPDPGDDVVR